MTGYAWFHGIAYLCMIIVVLEVGLLLTLPLLGFGLGGLFGLRWSTSCSNRCRSAAKRVRPRRATVICIAFTSQRKHCKIRGSPFPCSLTPPAFSGIWSGFCLTRPPQADRIIGVPGSPGTPRAYGSPGDTARWTHPFPSRTRS